MVAALWTATIAVSCGNKLKNIDAESISEAPTQVVLNMDAAQTENGMMQPHASVCGLMFSHPASRYFAVGKIDEEQLKDYAERRGFSVKEMRKYLSANLQD